ncbi:hypothetical protein HK097_002441 [Rhizophlyctis rosea]|uniref:Uncharacterized protein n=1 Tax=Rhizophlyctis rosea TaxID=64517 RepID=A0AAD5X184_9FUNG|nr:hypothetical protein HK097_002441 [Rhizophlyctis rosea]
MSTIPPSNPVESTPLSQKALPAPSDASTSIQPNSKGGYDLTDQLYDQLGPLVVNEDGTLSRIGNWHEMSDFERKNVLRVLGKRNKARLEKLKMTLGEDGGLKQKEEL